jgi:hypothetical protein
MFSCWSRYATAESRQGRDRVATPQVQLRALMASMPTLVHPRVVGPLGYHRSVDALVERLRQCTLALSNKLRQPREGFLMDLDAVPNDPPVEDNYLQSFICRIMDAYTFSIDE